MEFVPSSVDGVPIAFDVSGTGAPAIVFIHGLVGDHTDFDAQVAFFSRSHRVVAIDLPGAGQSGQDRQAWTMESLGQDVTTVVDHLGRDDVLLVGHSLGGNVTVEAALRLGHRVMGLVWVSSFRSLDSTMTPSEMNAWFASFDVDFAEAMDDLNRRNFGPNADPALVDAITARARKANRQRSLGLLRSKFSHTQSLVEALSNIHAPIFAINSDLKPNDAASFARHGVELRIIPGVGHFVMREDPDTFNDDLQNVLSTLP